MPLRPVTMEWRCRNCRFEQTVRVRVNVPPPRMLSPGSPVHEGDMRELYAQQGSWRSSRMKLARRPCPKCGAIDRKTVAQVVAVGAGGAFIIQAPLFVYLAAVLGRAGASPLWVLPGWLLITAAVVATRWFTGWHYFEGDIEVAEK